MDEISWDIRGSGGQVLVVSVPRELNHETSAGLGEVVRLRMPAVDGVGVVLDLSGTEMISSIGITALLEAQESAREVGGRMVMSGLSAELGAFMKMLGLAGRFSATAGVEEGIAAIEGGA